jgi:hypothetical protein
LLCGAARRRQGRDGYVSRLKSRKNITFRAIVSFIVTEISIRIRPANFHLRRSRCSVLPPLLLVVAAQRRPGGSARRNPEGVRPRVPWSVLGHDSQQMEGGRWEAGAPQRQLEKGCWVLSLVARRTCCRRRGAPLTEPGYYRRGRPHGLSLSLARSERAARACRGRRRSDGTGSPRAERQEAGHCFTPGCGAGGWAKRQMGGRLPIGRGERTIALGERGRLGLLGIPGTDRPRSFWSVCSRPPPKKGGARRRRRLSAAKSWTLKPFGVFT